MGIKNIETFYPLSPMQQGMLFHSLAAPQSGVYFEQFSCTFKGDLDIAGFKYAWQQVVKRHAVLRTGFAWEGLKEPVQVVHRQIELPFIQLDWRHLSPTQQQEQIDAFLERDRSQDFQLTAPPLIRLVLIQLADNNYHFTWSFHHLLLDGWSVPLIFQEIFAFYRAFSQKHDISLASPRPYRDYIVWLQQQNFVEAESFWREALKGFTAPQKLWTQSDPTTSDRQAISLNPSTTAALKALAQKHQITLNNVVQGAWAILLSRYSHQEDVVFGSTSSGRPSTLANSPSMVGLFINTLPVRVRVDREAFLLPWLQQIQLQQIEARQYEYTPLVEIQQWSEVPKGMPLFESIVVFENYPVEEIPLANSNLNLEFTVSHNFEKTNYPITLSVSSGQKLSLNIEYQRGKNLDAASINRLLGHLKTLLEDITLHPEVSLKELAFLTTAERHQLLVQWNDTQKDYPQDRCIHHLFEKQVEETPDAIAVAFEDRQLTYRELNNRANQLAHYLQDLGVKAEVNVGLYLERSLEMAVAILGTLKAGGAYTPVDPSYPPQRIKTILKDSHAAIVLTQQHLVTELSEIQTKIVSIDGNCSKIARRSPYNCRSKTISQNIAYVIYTSGSTGEPKGVAVTHQALVNYTLDIAEQFELHKSDRVLQFAAVGFDVVVEELFPTWSMGATVVFLGTKEPISYREFQQQIEKEQLTLFELPTAYWHQWVSELSYSQQTVPPCVRLVIVGGERISHERLRQWQQFQTSLVHVYGLTETTVTSTLYRLNKDTGSIELPIGTAIANTQIYLLDSHLQLVPVGVAGEIYIGGDGIARGYFNRPDLTAERFIANPFSQVAGARLYRTGDLARYLPDGNIEYIGRSDRQVKLRGYRLELGEIEAALNQHSAVAESVVMLQEDNPDNSRLIAYVTLQAKQKATINELHRHLKSKLPSYMVPSAFVILDAFPLTTNGKIDRQALSVLESDRFLAQNEYLAPATPTQEILAGIWQDTLGVERVGVSDNFFELGGHSLIATRVVSQVRKVFQIELPLRSLFEKPTIADLAQEIETASKTRLGLESATIKPIARRQEIPLSFAQQRLWFLAQLEPDNPFYNQPIALRLSGQLNIAVLKQSFNELVRRHEPLRTKFVSVEGKPTQSIDSVFELQLPVIDLKTLEKTTQEREIQTLALQEAQRPFNLEKDALLRVTLLQLSASDCVILFTTHHIVSDGWSIAVLIKEIATLYRAYLQGKRSPLPELPIQYADFAVWQREWMQGEVLSRQLDYWKQQLQDLPRLDLPSDYPRLAIQSYKGATQCLRLPKRLSKALKTLAQEESVTLYMTLLAAFQTLLYRYTGQSDIAVGSAIANRNRAEIEGLIGFFVNTLVMRSKLDGKLSFRELLRQVRKTTFEAYEHQDLPFEKLVAELKIERDLRYQPLSQVTFEFQTLANNSLELPELSLKSLEIEEKTAKYDLTLFVSETEQELVGTIEYSTDLFEAETIARMLQHYQHLLEAIATNRDSCLEELPLLTEAEQEQLKAWNATQTDDSVDESIQQLWETQVAKTPDAIAIVQGDRYLTYQELNVRANQIAHYLNSLHVSAEDAIAICLEKSPEAIAGLFGILKSGGAYLPIDPTSPQERAIAMLEDARVKLVLTEQKLAHLFSHTEIQVICLDSDWQNIASASANNPTNVIQKENLSYIIYTSGSTGKPKGVAIAHQSLVNYTKTAIASYEIESGDRVLQFASLSFDAAAEEIFPTLVRGGSLILRTDELLNSISTFLRLARQYQLTVLDLPTAFWHHLVAEMSASALTLPESLRLVILGGETASPERVTTWLKQTSRMRLVNSYGPTEATIVSTISNLSKQATTIVSRQQVPIGKPIHNTQTYILDGALKPLPIGIAGELYIGGDGIARGYLHRPDLTATAFIPDPFAQKPGMRLYKTGDLARYRADGEIEFLGRLDKQVKLRGFRIEIGEIEAELARHPAVKEAIAMIGEETGDRRLVAYIVPDRELSATLEFDTKQKEKNTRSGMVATSGKSNYGIHSWEQELPGSQLSSLLRQYLKAKLPQYMVPSAFVMLSELPLTSNGKIDYRALPALDTTRLELEETFVAPRNSIEEAIAQIWCQVLNLDRIGIHDNFFEIGGHSLLLIQVNSKLRQRFATDLSIVEMFRYPTINSLSEYLSKFDSHQALSGDRLDNEKLKAGKLKQKMRREKMRSL